MFKIYTVLLILTITTVSVSLLIQSRYFGYSSSTQSHRTTVAPVIPSLTRRQYFPTSSGGVYSSQYRLRSGHSALRAAGTELGQLVEYSDETINNAAKLVGVMVGYCTAGPLGAAALGVLTVNALSSRGSSRKSNGIASGLVGSALTSAGKLSIDIVNRCNYFLASNKGNINEEGFPDSTVHTRKNVRSNNSSSSSSSSSNRLSNNTRLSRIDEDSSDEMLMFNMLIAFLGNIQGGPVGAVSSVAICNAISRSSSPAGDLLRSVQHDIGVATAIQKERLLEYVSSLGKEDMQSALKRAKEIDAQCGISEQGQRLVDQSVDFTSACWKGILLAIKDLSCI